MALTNWPFTAPQVRKAVGLKADDTADEADLELWAQFVTELVDKRTGRDEDPTRYLIAVTTEEGPAFAVPTAFIMAARVSARLLWQQERNGTGSSRSAAAAGEVVPQGADMPAKARSWLKDYPASPLVA